MTDELKVCGSCGMSIHSGPCKITTPYKAVAEELFEEIRAVIRKAEKVLGAKFKQES